VRAWHALVGMYQAIEATHWGDLLLGNVWPAYLFGMALGAHVLGLPGSIRVGSLDGQLRLLQDVATIAFLALTVVLFAIRRRGLKGQRATLGQSAVALLGTFLLNVVAFLPVEDSTSATSLLASSIVVLLGTVFTIWSLAVLGRCFGLFPEVRGLVLRGPYRFVRHPVYLGEVVAALGLLLAKPHLPVVALVAVFVVLQYWRTVNEERALVAAYPSQYPAYAQQVPRLLPGVR